MLISLLWLWRKSGTSIPNIGVSFVEEKVNEITIICAFLNHQEIHSRQCFVKCRNITETGAIATNSNLANLTCHSIPNSVGLQGQSILQLQGLFSVILTIKIAFFLRLCHKNLWSYLKKKGADSGKYLTCWMMMHDTRYNFLKE